MKNSNFDPNDTESFPLDSRFHNTLNKAVEKKRETGETWLLFWLLKCLFKFLFRPRKSYKRYPRGKSEGIEKAIKLVQKEILSPDRPEREIW